MTALTYRKKRFARLPCAEIQAALRKTLKTAKANR
jgi:hypothetical protein